MTTDDYTKDLEEEIARYALPNPYRPKRAWRLLFVSSDGRVAQSGNYQRVVTTTLVILTLLSLSLLATTSLWLQARGQLAEAVVRQRDLNESLSRQRASKELLMARLALAEEKNPPAASGTSKPALSPIPREASLSPLTPFVRADTFETLRSEDETLLTITFKLHNDTPHKSLAKGRMFLVFPPRDGSDHTPRSLPPVLLNNGVPADPTLGESFQMHNFNNLNFKLRTKAGELDHNEVILYVFDDNGSLRYEKKFPL